MPERLLALGLGFLRVVLGKGQPDDWFGSHFVRCCNGVAAIGRVGAIVWELRQKELVIELHLFKDRNCATAATMFALGIVLCGATVLLPAPRHPGFWPFVLVWMTSCGALAILFVPIDVTAFSFVSNERMNSASGLINRARNIGGSGGYRWRPRRRLASPRCIKPILSAT